ncbi:MAG: hypothetical protein KC416_07455, partial [Myxococcales bacterium]|nr:hypothetical protein [Myxococcales bacterium]
MGMLNPWWKPLAWSAFGFCALVVSAVLHLNTPLARATARETLTLAINDAIQGQIEAGSLRTLSMDEIVMDHLVLRDASGTRVLVARKVRANLRWAALLVGEVRFTEVEVEGLTVRLRRDGTPMPTFISAFFPKPDSNADESAGNTRVFVDRLSTRGGRVYGDLPSVEGFAAANVDLDAHLSVTDAFRFVVTEGRAEVLAPYPLRGSIDKIDASFSSEAAEGTEVAAEATLRLPDGTEQHIAAALTYRDDAELDLRVRSPRFRASTLSTFGFSWARLIRGDAPATLHLAGPVDDLRLAVDAEPAAGPVKVRGSIRPESTEITLASEGVNLGEVVRGGPEVRVAGQVTLRLDAATDRRVVELELQDFLYEGWAIPSIILEGTLEEDRLVIRSARVPYAGGEVRAQGDIYFDGTVELSLQGHLAALHLDPNLQRVIPGVGGRADGQVRLKIANGSTEIRGRTTFRNLRVASWGADTLAVDGILRVGEVGPQVDMLVQALGPEAYGARLTRVEAKITGGPRRFLTRTTADIPGGARVTFGAEVLDGGTQYVVRSSEVRVDTADAIWTGGIGEVVVVPGDGVEIHGAVIHHATERLEVGGHWGLGSDSDLVI